MRSSRGARGQSAARGPRTYARCIGRTPDAEWSLARRNNRRRGDKFGSLWDAGTRVLLRRELKRQLHAPVRLLFLTVFPADLLAPLPFLRPIFSPSDTEGAQHSAVTSKIHIPHDRSRQVTDLGLHLHTTGPHSWSAVARRLQ